MKKKPKNLPIRMRRLGKVLSPSTAFAERMLAAVPDNSEVEIHIRRRRSLSRLALYWSILHAIVDGGYSQKYPTPYHLHEAIKLALGYVTTLITLDGKTVIIPDSVAFDAMDETAFSDYFTRAMELLARLLGTDPIELLKEAA